MCLLRPRVTSLIVRFLGTLLGFWLLTVLPAGAQPGTADEPSRLEPVVVTATKTLVPRRDLGSSITVIDREEIEVRQTSEMIDLLPTVPGLHISEQNTRGGLSFVEPRGAPFTFNQVLIDGVKLNNAGGLMNWAGLSLVNIDRVEVLRGPQSALYGVDAAGSVIQFFTARGEGPLRAEASVVAGNQGTIEETATLRGGVGPFGYSLGVHHVDTDGSLPVNSGFDSTTASGRFDWVREKFAEATVTVRFTDSHHGVPVFVGGDRFLPLDPHQFVDQQRLLLSGRVSHWITPEWKHTLQLGYLRHRIDLVDPFDAGIDFRAVTSDNVERRYSADYFWTVSLPPLLDVATTVVAGVAYEREELDQDVIQGPPFPTRTTHDAARREVRSAYVQAQLDWKKRLFLTPGVRVDDSSSFGTEVTPRVSAAAIVSPLQTKARAAYSEGVRAPSFAQLVGDGGIGFANGNPNLRPERAKSWEVGVDQPLAGGRIELSATYFHTRFEDLITFVAGATPSSSNVGVAEAKGVETTATVRPLPGLTLTGSYTYLRTKILDNGGIAVTESPVGAPLVRQPTHAGSLTVEYLWNRLRASLTGIFVGGREDVDVLTMPAQRVHLAGYAKLDAAIAYDLLRDVAHFRTLTLFGKARNFTDERYEDFFGFSAPRATFLIGLRASF